MTADRSAADALSGSEQSKGKSSAVAPSILLIDDNDDVARAIEIACRMAGYTIERANGAQDAYSKLALRRFDAIILDLNFSPGKTDGSEGLACLDRILTDDPSACVVLLTAHGGVRVAVAAMQAGARDFVVKPWNNADLIAKLGTAIHRKPVSGTMAAPTARGQGTDSTAAPSPAASLLGECPAIVALRDMIHRVGPTTAGVTITGPSGSGRTLTALCLHATSPHAGQNPVVLDLRDTAQWERLPGIQGTAILRHPDRLDDVAQHRLLTALPANARAIAVADDLDRVLPALRHRIAVVELKVPPLAERGDDVVILARHFLRLAAERHRGAHLTLDDSAVDALRLARWPDDVRGLATTIERAVLLANGDTIGREAFAPSLPPPPVAAPGKEPGATPEFDLDLTEKALITAALREYGHNITKAAQALGLSRASLYRRMDRHGL